MNTTIETHCDTALNSTYSRDREEAIEELGRIYPDASTDGQTRILETLRQVAHESSSRDERSLARETLLECFENAPGTAMQVVVETVSELAESSKFSEERLEAIDMLRRIYSDVDEHHRDEIGRTLADIAGNATYEDERRRARRRLSDISREEHEETVEAGGTETASDTIGYLGVSLADHLDQAAHEGPEECRKRAEEVSEFLAENPVADDSYDDVRSDVESLVEQLAVVPTGNSLDEDRIDRVERISARIERLYERS